MMFFPFSITWGNASLQHEVDDDVDDGANDGQCARDIRNQCFPAIWLVGV
jgi:hypothetical protein